MCEIWIIYFMLHHHHFQPLIWIKHPIINNHHVPQEIVILRNTHKVVPPSYKLVYKPH